jgi:hypothetical protein
MWGGWWGRSIDSGCRIGISSYLQTEAIYSLSRRSREVVRCLTIYNHVLIVSPDCDIWCASKRRTKQLTVRCTDTGNFLSCDKSLPGASPPFCPKYPPYFIDHDALTWAASWGGWDGDSIVIEPYKCPLPGSFLFFFYMMWQLINENGVNKTVCGGAIWCREKKTGAGGYERSVGEQKRDSDVSQWVASRSTMLGRHIRLGDPLIEGSLLKLPPSRWAARQSEAGSWRLYWTIVLHGKHNFFIKDIREG